MIINPSGIIESVHVVLSGKVLRPPETRLEIRTQAAGGLPPAPDCGRRPGALNAVLIEPQNNWNSLEIDI